MLVEFAFASFVDWSIEFYSTGRKNRFSEDAFRRAIAELGKRGWQIATVGLQGIYLQKFSRPTKRALDASPREAQEDSNQGSRK